MTIIELLNSFKDIEFKSKRMLKSKKIDLAYLKQFDLRCEEIRLQILQMDLSEDINSTFKKIERIKVDYLPSLNFKDKTANVLTFGYTKKQKIKKKTDSYYRDEILHRKISFQHVETHLKEN